MKNFIMGGSEYSSPVILLLFLPCCSRENILPCLQSFTTYISVHLLKALVGVNVVQPDQVVVVQQEAGRVQDQLRGGAGQLVQALAAEVQGVRVSPGALTDGGVLSGHLANLGGQISISEDQAVSMFTAALNSKYK